ncbi:MAG: hypothetical protein ABI832_13250 [bacterium]
MTKTPRPTHPRRWATAALTTVTLAALPTLAGTRPPAPITLASPNAKLWLAQSQGGEGGESGIAANASTDAAYLAELAIVEGHMLAAADLYALGLNDQAVDLSLHPQQEGTLDTLRADIAAHNMPDPAQAITAFTVAMQAEAAQTEVNTALTAVSEVFAADAAAEADQTRARFDAVVLLVKAAAEEYNNAIANGEVTDLMGWHEARSFIAIARRDLQALATIPLSAKAAPKALTALDATTAVFGDPLATAPMAGDPQVLLGIAAKVELIASSVR